MIKLEQIPYTDERFRQVLRLRYLLLDVPVGAPEITEPSDNDKRPENTHLIAQDDERVVSAVRLDESEDGEFVVRRMITDPEYQRQGIGRRAMMLVETLVQSRDGQIVRLNSTPEALDFYHKLGYEDTGEGVEWAGVYHTEMTKQI